MSEERDKAWVAWWRGGKTEGWVFEQTQSAFNSGWDARDAKTCEWTEDEDLEWAAACSDDTFEQPMLDFCPNCGGRIVESK